MKAQIKVLMVFAGLLFATSCQMSNLESEVCPIRGDVLFEKGLADLNRQATSGGINDVTTAGRINSAYIAGRDLVNLHDGSEIRLSNFYPAQGDTVDVFLVFDPANYKFASAERFYFAGKGYPIDDHAPAYFDWAVWHKSSSDVSSTRIYEIGQYPSYGHWADWRTGNNVTTATGCSSQTGYCFAGGYTSFNLAGFPVSDWDTVFLDNSAIVNHYDANGVNVNSIFSPQGYDYTGVIDEFLGVDNIYQGDINKWEGAWTLDGLYEYTTELLLGQFVVNSSAPNGITKVQVVAAAPSNENFNFTYTANYGKGDRFNDTSMKYNLNEPSISGVKYIEYDIGGTAPLDCMACHGG